MQGVSIYLEDDEYYPKENGYEDGEKSFQLCKGESLAGYV